MESNPFLQLSNPSYSEYIYKSRYARWLDDKNRREHWFETVSRYIDYFRGKFPQINPELWIDLGNAIYELEVMPSMRALMTAGKALDRDNVAGYNCAYMHIDDPKCFDELMYILMCFHSKTEVITESGNKFIKDLKIGDKVLSFNEDRKKFVWQRVLNVIENNTKDKEKVRLTFENGSEIYCTSDHKFLTNVGWIEAKDLTLEHDVVSPKYYIYKLRNKETNKVYIGITSKSAEQRFDVHYRSAFIKTSQAYSTKLSKAIRKHNDRNVWEITTIDYAYSQREGYKKEKEYVQKYDSKNLGYNLTDGGEGTLGVKWTEESKKKASENAYIRTEEHRKNNSLVLKKAMPKILETRKTEKYKQECRERSLGEKNNMYGKKHSLEHKQKIGNAIRGEKNGFFGKKHSTETKKRISEKQKIRMKNEINPFKDKKHTDTTKEKMHEYWSIFKLQDKNLSLKERHLITKQIYSMSV